MTYSYTQISQYLSCPRRYRHRYLDGWQEKDTRAPCSSAEPSNRPLPPFFVRKTRPLCCSSSGACARHGPDLLRQRHLGPHAATRHPVAGALRSGRPRSHSAPRSTQQIQFNRTLGSGNNFVAYVDAIGELDGTPCVLEWKTTSARYPEEPAGISALDPQLVCYSWMTGIDEVAQVVFVRKRLVEVQYLRATISDEQRQEFATLVDDTVRRIESGLFLPHSGIRFPQNPCTTCPFIGLCLDKPELVEAALVRKPGVDLGLFDELVY
jgi:hypothetical protein